MGKRYQHLRLEEREWIFAWRQQGISFREVGKRLARSHTTISRELKRNAPYFQEYIPVRAQRWYEKRGGEQRRKAPLKEPFIYLYVREHLRERQTPEAIAGRLSLDYPGKQIHHETIYRYIYGNDTKKEQLWHYLKLHKRKRMKWNGRKVRSEKIANMISIEKRPKVVERRNQFGHWETDLMEGKRTEKKVVSVQVERKTRYLMMSLLTDKKAGTKFRDITNTLGWLPKEGVRSITADRGSENAYHERWRDSIKTDVYFCHAYHSWEKGGVENSIGRVRRWFPKREGLMGVTQEVLDSVVERENNTPRKCLGWLTPCERMEDELQKLHTN